jgi:hypothetical protein
MYWVCENGGYIKGYGLDTVRLMSANHTPILNAPKSDLTVLVNWGAVRKDGLKYIFNNPPPKID